MDALEHVLGVADMEEMEARADALANVWWAATQQHHAPSVFADKHLTIMCQIAATTGLTETEITNTINTARKEGA